MKPSLVQLLFLAATVVPATSGAVPVVTLGSGNVGIDSINVTVVGSTISIEEFWTSPGIGAISFGGLDTGVNYTVEKIIHNNSAVDWTSLANELLDPAGQTNDASDGLPYPTFVPAGFTTSNDGDGLSFAQGSALPRTSSVFANVIADELTVRDFLDFFNGTLSAGATDDFMTFGLRDFNPDVNQPFVLVQRPNASSVPVPEPLTIALLGIAMVAFAFTLRRRKK